MQDYRGGRYCIEKEWDAIVIDVDAIGLQKRKRERSGKEMNLEDSWQDELNQTSCNNKDLPDRVIEFLCRK
ncbi:hypothetical protein E2562_019216 [Oryza meyeriana var. granulata]|uniref:Uncharacterized protein n=1 Tax=Oryza meyeriana var. granulata TaxID=110450 RepID=A0A6G1FA94_9ORYZ|nr:hypothetical protein E2562_019216 [Oryza meyeriana var. granulata]